MSAWRPIETFVGNDYERVDLWVDVWASPRSMGMADAWRATDCWRQDGKWHDKGGELYQHYITHWMPIPEAPKSKRLNRQKVTP